MSTGLSDKDMAVIFKKDAGDYMIAAENLRVDENSIWLVGPTNFMRSHAIELLLKAALLANGWTVEQCRKKLGHKLVEAMDEAEALGLTLTDQTKNVIRTLSPLHEDYTFRYQTRTHFPIKQSRLMQSLNYLIGYIQ
ncbi:MAG: hypothetical protein E7813_08350 [Bradyrhizobium sp.]|uniref:hypothetical protein n=1 Tax=Bradyrhizobium sp. TaxID=376 RepID=UPI0011F8AEE3|nr:hypothetical protein [Bradyrhizobium sp.]THD70427.1 MAG: hypothetical protein E7813_08350 [Bradyrhizobium sp.]